MKPVLIQSIMRSRRKSLSKSGPIDQEIEKTANGIVSFILAALFVIVVGSIAIAA